MIHILSFLGGVVITAIAENILSRFWRRPRPSASLLSVSLAPSKMDDTTEVTVPTSILRLAEASPLAPSVESAATVGNLRKFLRLIDSNSQKALTVSDFVRRLLARPTLLEPGETEDQQRLSLLREWIAYGSEIEHWAVGTIRGHMHAVPAIYKQPHPANWKDGASTTVRISESRGYKLREIPDTEVEQEISVQGPVGIIDTLRSEVQAANVLRRFWIYLRPNDIQWLLARMAETIDRCRAEAQRLSRQVEDMLRSVSPDYVVVDVIAANDGDRGFGVRREGVLCLRVRRQDGVESDCLIPLSATGDSPARTETLLVPGSSAVSIRYRSASPVDTLSITGTGGELVMDGQRIRALFEARAVPCLVAVPYTGLGTGKVQVLKTKVSTFGVAADAEVMQELARSVQTSESQ